MITHVRGNILEADCDTLVNPVNCVGVSGKGLALAFKRKFPEATRQYEEKCRAGEVKIGLMLLIKEGNQTLIYFPTKGHWQKPSYLSFIETGLEDLCRVFKAGTIHRIAIPALGCGLGGLDWNEVRPLICRYLEPLQGLEIQLFEPLNPFPNG